MPHNNYNLCINSKFYLTNLDRELLRLTLTGVIRTDWEFYFFNA